MRHARARSAEEGDAAYGTFTTADEQRVAEITDRALTDAFDPEVVAKLNDLAARGIWPAMHAGMM